MKTIINLILAGIAVAIADYLLPGVALNSFITAIIVGLILGIVNSLVRPILLILTLPLNLLTFGLFTFVINALMILLTAAIVPGFDVAGFWTALLFSIIVSILKMVFNGFETATTHRPI